MWRVGWTSISLPLIWDSVPLFTLNPQKVSICTSILPKSAIAPDSACSESVRDGQIDS